MSQRRLRQRAARQRAGEVRSCVLTDSFQKPASGERKGQEATVDRKGKKPPPIKGRESKPRPIGYEEETVHTARSRRVEPGKAPRQNGQPGRRPAGRPFREVHNQSSAGRSLAALSPPSARTGSLLASRPPLYPPAFRHRQSVQSRARATHTHTCVSCLGIFGLFCNVGFPHCTRAGCTVFARWTSGPAAPTWAETTTGRGGPSSHHDHHAASHPGHHGSGEAIRRVRRCGGANGRGIGRPDDSRPCRSGEREGHR